MQRMGRRIPLIAAIMIAAFGTMAVGQPPAAPQTAEQPSPPAGMEALPPNGQPSSTVPPSEIETLPAPAMIPQPTPADDGARAEFGPRSGSSTTHGATVSENASWFPEGMELAPEGAGMETFWDEPVVEGFPFMWGVEASWSFRTEVMILQRQGPRNILISRDGSTTGGPDLMTTKSISFNIEPGMRITAQRFLGSDLAKRDYLLELSYFGLQDWDEARTITGQRVDLGGGFESGSLVSNFPLTVGGFNRADVHRIEYSSQIDNVEMNLRVSSRPRRERLVYRPERGWMTEPSDGINLSMLGGMRLLVIDEAFDFMSRANITQNGTSLGIASGDYRIETRNRLWGLQIGLSIDSQTPRFAWAVTGRMGPYVNFMRQQQNITFVDDADPFATAAPDRDRRDNDERVAVVGQLSITGRFRLFEHVNLRAGYDFLWVQGLALAPEQLDFQMISTAPINRNGKTLYQGLSLGAELVW